MCKKLLRHSRVLKSWHVNVLFLLICHITFFLKFIGCLNAMIKYDWLAEVSTLMWLVERRCDFITNCTARSAIRAEIALLWTNQIAGNTIDFKMNITNQIHIICCCFVLKKSPIESYVHRMHWIQWTLSFGYLSGLVSTWRPYACHYIIERHVNWETKKRMSNGNSICHSNPMDKQNSNWHFHVHWIHWTLSFDYLNSLVSTWHPYACHYVIKDMLIDKQKKQMSNGHSICSLDPMDANVQLTIRG
jgi:hypothetical protein